MATRFNLNSLLVILLVVLTVAVVHLVREHFVQRAAIVLLQDRVTLLERNMGGVLVRLKRAPRDNVANTAAVPAK
jgi:uncharacterized membrane protein YwaF